MKNNNGARIRTRAVMLCKDVKFWDFIASNLALVNMPKPEEFAKGYICKKCNIESRSELTSNKEAQSKFKKLDQRFIQWLNPIDEIYADNLEREN